MKNELRSQSYPLTFLSMRLGPARAAFILRLEDVELPQNLEKTINFIQATEFQI